MVFPECTRQIVGGDPEVRVLNTFIHYEYEHKLTSRSSRRIKTAPGRACSADEGSTGSDVDLGAQRCESIRKSIEQSDGEVSVDGQCSPSPSLITITSFDDCACTTNEFAENSPPTSPSGDNETRCPFTDTCNTANRSIVIGFACAQGQGCMNHGLAASSVHASKLQWIVPMLPMMQFSMPRMPVESTRPAFEAKLDRPLLESLSQSQHVPQKTTVMVRNIPLNYKRSDLKAFLDSRGFPGRFNFLYMPIDYERGVGKGYAFVNLVTHADATQMQELLQGFEFRRWSGNSKKVCEVCWAEPHQGLPRYIEVYQNNSVMHPRIADEYKPIILENGVRTPFPPPTKKLRYPRKAASDDSRPHRK